MSLVTQHLCTLKPAAQKLVCLFAYIGGDMSDDDKTQLSVHGTCMLGELPLLTKSLVDDGLVSILPPTHFNPERQCIRARYWGDVMLFAMEEHGDWLEEFDAWPLARHRDMHALQKAVRSCYDGNAPEPMVLPSELPPYLIGLAHDRRFEPLLTMIRDVDFPAFISAVIRKWMRDDYLDEHDMLKRQMMMRKFDMTDSDIKEMRALWNYYIFVCQGQYTPPTSIRMSYSDLLQKGVHAMSQGKSDLALKVLSEAVSASARTSAGRSEARYLVDGVASFYWVLAIWMSKQNDSKTKLRDFVAYVRQSGNWRRVGAAVLLAETLTSPLQRMNMDLLAQLLNPVELADKEFVLQQRMALLLAANFTGYQLTKDNFQPQSAFLRHEGSAYVTLNRFEKKTLTTAFGAKPITAVAKGKEPWEQMLDRLITTESRRQPGADEETGQRRLMYIITSDGESVEVREQVRLKDGHWGSGKSLPWSRFIGGTEPFMDRTDQAVVADVRYLQAQRLTAGIIMPHLVGSDRVYSGEHTPFRRVTIEEQKPYVIIERTETEFRVQSNVLFRDLISQTNVYHRDDELHYVFFRMDDHERAVLQELLSVASLPLQAEKKLTQLLPLIMDVVDIHSDLVERETVLPTEESQSTIIMRLTPDPTAQTYFDVLMVVRPLPGGQMAVTPGQGDRAIIDKSERTAGRIRLERDLEAEQRNLQAVLQHCIDSGIELSRGLSAHLSTPQVLDLLSFVTSHPEVCAVEWPEGERLRMHSASGDGWNIGLKPRGRWFEIEGDVKLDDNSVLTAQQLLQALGGSRGGYVQLQNGDYLWLSETLRRQLERLESMATQENGRPCVSALQTSLLADVVHGEIDIRCSDDFRELKQRIDAADAMTPEPPAGLEATLRPYQLEGYQWMTRLAAWGAGACLADDMGLGKTVQTIAFLLAHAQEGPSLVVAPASVVANWQAELQRFAPSLACYRMGDYYDRCKLVDEAGSGDVIITTYGLMMSTSQFLQSREWNTVCLDEAHVIKNRGTKTSAAIMQLQASHRIILTGTPVQNHLGELWNLFQFINPGLLGSYELFSQKYIQPIESMQDDERQTQLQTLVAPFMLRRTKQAVVTELPEKTEITLSIELSDDEMAYYEAMRRQAEEHFRQDGNQMSVNVLAELTHLRQAACAVELVDDTWAAGSSKVNAFMELAQEIVDGGNSVLVFSQFTSLLKVVRQKLDEANLPYLYLDGSVTVRQREQLVADFQKGKRPIFLISLKAGGVGLNLTAANYVVHLDPWWNPAIEQQATDRAYRIGQKQAVTVYHLITHHTIEEKILRLHDSKRALSDSILEGADKGFHLDAAEMLEMLSNQW